MQHKMTRTYKQHEASQVMSNSEPDEISKQTEHRFAHLHLHIEAKQNKAT